MKQIAEIDACEITADVEAQPVLTPGLKLGGGRGLAYQKCWRRATRAEAWPDKTEVSMQGSKWNELVNCFCCFQYYILRFFAAPKATFYFFLPSILNNIYKWVVPPRVLGAVWWPDIFGFSWSSQSLEISPFLQGHSSAPSCLASRQRACHLCKTQ